MADQKELPEGTDTVISGAAVESENEEQLIVREPKARDKMLEKVREGRGKLAGQAADKTRGLVGQGLERSSEALANVSKLVGDTAEGLDERLGEEYGDYARKAATAIDDVANSLASPYFLNVWSLSDLTFNFTEKALIAKLQKGKATLADLQKGGATQVCAIPLGNDTCSTCTFGPGFPDNGNWTEQQRLTAPSPQSGMGFAEAVAVYGDVIAIGASNTPSSLMPPRGQVFMFERKGAAWEQVKVLSAPVPRTADFYGSSLVLTPTLLAVGANGDPSSATGLQGDMRDTSQRLSGAVYLYARRGSELELSTYIKPFNTDGQDAFGAELALAGDMLITAAAFEGSAGSGINPPPTGSTANSGAVYVFQ